MKYLLCRPLGGLNDNFCTINFCLEYCKKYNRILLIDTYYDNNLYKYKFENIFKLNDTNIIADNDLINNIIYNNKLTIFDPKLYAYSYQDIFNDNFKFIKFAKLLDDYNEDIVIYNSNVGRSVSIYGSYNLIKNIKLINNHYLRIIKERYNNIPKPYISIHIRNTGYKFDYKSFFYKNKDLLIDKNIFLATDSLDVLNYFKNQNLKIFQFTLLINNKPFHKQENKNKLLDTLSDLILLAYGNEFIESIGGFSELANYLFKNKDILNNFVDNKIIDNKN